MLRCPSEITTISKAKEWIVATAISLKQCKCPVCGQTAKLYPRKLSSALASFLVDLYILTAHLPPARRWVNVSKDMIDKTDHHVSRDYAKLRFWGLLVPSAADAGMWRITDSGIAFVEGRLVTPKIAYVYNNYCVRLSEATTDIEGALGSKFDLKSMMRERKIA
jgi:hypothetical protein